MKTTADISKRALALFIITPLLGVYLLSTSCTIGDLLFDCCTQHQMQHCADGAHTTDGETSRHNTADDPSNSCCSDQVISFFSMFQMQPQLPVLKIDRPVDLPDIMSWSSNFSILSQTNPYSIIYKEYPFILIKRPGRILRILHQSFLN